MFPAGQRLMAAPGMGVLTATALVAAVGHAAEFRNGRQMPAWLRLVARQRWTGGRSTLLGISKRDDAYPRTILIHGAGLDSDHQNFRRVASLLLLPNGGRCLTRMLPRLCG